MDEIEKSWRRKSHRCSILKDRRKKEYKPEKLREDVTNGGVAQLGEHLPCKQGVMGSNPIISTRGKRWREDTPRILNGLIAQVVRARA